MIRIAVWFFVLSCLLSCGQNKKDDLQRRREQIKADRGLKAKEQQEKIERARTDSLAAIAWGDAVWGMTRDEVLRTKAFGDGKDYGYTIEMSETRKQKTKELFGLKKINSLRAYIRDNSLQSIFIESWWCKTKDFDALVSECNILMRNFTRLYGSPKEHHDITFSGFNSEGIQTVATYSIGEYGIQKTISICLHKREYEYWYKVSIYPITLIKRDDEPIARSIHRLDDADNKNDDVTILSF